jgi:hypothetical protein
MFEDDGTPVQLGSATTWDDERVPVTSLAKGGVSDPGFAAWKKNAGGTSLGVFIYWFDKTTEEELFFALQIPHSWKEGSTIYPHVHWIPKTNGAVGSKVCWGLEYTVQSLGGVFGTTTIIHGNTAILNETPVADKHYLTRLNGETGIVMTGQTISCMLHGRFFRDAGSVLATDDYDDDAGLLEIDFHIEKDTNGSRTETTK